jgi:pyridoxal phosphate enzyme (YggS family)
LSLAENLKKVEERIERACGVAGRGRQEITLVAVTKVFPADRLIEAYEAGCRDFGENYVQEFEAKHPQVQHLEGARFHLIGHLQSNKSRKAGEIFHCIQTVDSPKLARRLNEPKRPLDVFLEVKLSEEESKAGVAPSELAGLIASVRECEHLRLRGLMTMPPWSDDPELSRPYFRRLRELAREHGLSELSMGMSHDFEVAIEEGSTMIRVGTALFGRRVRPSAT